ncbi:MAG: 5'-nucleotidase C-terminal domain-containing protein [Proteobacteria bacterium]|nr:5'-nucleotidase C-terminal domain-containing protein [Pseudomonadota bacterium]
MSRSRAVVLAVVAACSKAPVAPDAVPTADAPATVSIDILAFNDFHGALEPSPVGTGGAAFLAAKVASLRTPNTLVLAAGDMIGASPLVSGLFHDEPTIDVMNAIGLDYAAVGNHEFDEGTAELLRMQHGGCHPVDGCAPGTTFTGATFGYLAANVVDTTTGHTVLPAYAIREIAGVKLAIVGMTLVGTPATTLASGISELTFADEVDTMTALLPELRAAGANIVVLALHQGGGQLGDPDQCVSPGGPVFDIADRLDPAVAVVLAGHSHTTFNCTRGGGRLVTSAGVNGQFLTHVTLEIDVATQAVVSATAHNVPITDDVAPDPVVAGIVTQYHDLAAPIGDRVIGTITADLAGGSAAGELVMGDVIADAMLDGTTAQVAVMNRGGVRAPLLFARSGNEPVDGQVTYAEAFKVQPFNNLVETVTAPTSSSRSTTGLGSCPPRSRA